MVSKMTLIGMPSARALSRSTSVRYCGTDAVKVVCTPRSSGRWLAAATTLLVASERLLSEPPERSCRKNSKPPVTLMPRIGGGLKPIDDAVLEVGVDARASAGATLRASSLGSVRCDQSFRVTKEMPELDFSARDRRSKPEKVTTLATAGFFISAAVASLVTSRVRAMAAAGGSTVTMKT